jgi:hypothetical protein
VAAVAQPPGRVGQHRPPVPREEPEQAGGASLPRRPRRQALASGLGRNRSPQLATLAATPPRTGPSPGASRLPRNPPTVATARMAATRQGRVRVQAAHSAAAAAATARGPSRPGRSTLVRTRIATTGRSPMVPASSWSGNRWGLGLAMEASLLWRASRRPAPGLAGHAAPEIAGALGFGGGLGVAGCGRRPAAWPGAARWPHGPAAGRPTVLGRPAPGRGPTPIGDAVGVPVVLDLGGGVAPGPPAPGRRRYRAEGLQDITRPVGFDGQAGGPPPPSQGPHHLPILGAKMRTGLQPTPT